MHSSLLIVTGSNGYILNDFNFNDYNKYFKIIYIHNQNDKVSKNHFSYNELIKLESVVKDVNIKSIVFISFGSHLGGHDPGMYFKSVNNLETIIKILVNANKKLFLYHSSSFSTFNPILNSCLNPFFISFYPDYRGPYSFSKYKQDCLIKAYSSFSENLKSKIIYLGHVYSKENNLIDRFMPKSITFGKIVFSFLYSPFKLINPISKKRIHQDISNFLKSHQNMKDDIEYVYLTEKDSPISLFKVFLNNKKFFISPIAPIISLFISILILFCRRNSNLNFYLIKYLQMNNSIKI